LGPARTYAPNMGRCRQMDGHTPSPPCRVIYGEDELALFARYGVGDMVGLEGTEDRVVMLSPTSSLGCPMHERRLLPDACRSCRFLAGEAASNLANSFLVPTRLGRLVYGLY
jgi:hypothetical protein